MNESTIRLALASWLKSCLGTPHKIKLSFDADFVAGNVINATINAVANTAVNFSVSHENTLTALAKELQKHPAILIAAVTGAKEITITGLSPGTILTFSVLTVAGGVSQPVSTLTTLESPVAVTVIMADQAADRPLQPYATIRYGSIQSIGHDERGEIDDQGISTVKGQRRMTVSVQYLGQNPVQEIMKAVNGLEKMSVHEAFLNAGLSVMDVGPIQNLTNFLETSPEPRATFDFYLGLAENIFDDVGVIEKVELTGELDDNKSGDVIFGPQIIEA